MGESNEITASDCLLMWQEHSVEDPEPGQRPGVRLPGEGRSLPEGKRQPQGSGPLASLRTPNPAAFSFSQEYIFLSTWPVPGHRHHHKSPTGRDQKKSLRQAGLGDELKDQACTRAPWPSGARQQQRLCTPDPAAHSHW